MMLQMSFLRVLGIVDIDISRRETLHFRARYYSEFAPGSTRLVLMIWRLDKVFKKRVPSY